VICTVVCALNIVVTDVFISVVEVIDLLWLFVWPAMYGLVIIKLERMTLLLTYQ